MKRAKKCDHVWRYEHALWQTKENDDSSVSVGRYCFKCGKQQTATASNWKPLPKSFGDMRETMAKSFQKP